MTRAVVTLSLSLFFAWSACRPPATPRGEWDEPCPGRVPMLDRVRLTDADEAAAIWVQTNAFLSVPGTSPYARRHEGWSFQRTGILVERRGASCTAEREVVWRKGKECELEHRSLAMADSVCGDFLRCALGATPRQSDGMSDCSGACIDCDEWTVESKKDRRYRGCRWDEAPACVADQMRRLTSAARAQSAL